MLLRRVAATLLSLAEIVGSGTPGTCRAAEGVANPPLVAANSAGVMAVQTDTTPAEPQPVGEAGEVPELGLADVFRRPIGPRGLEFSERAKSLAGQTVRITGYLVRQASPIPFAGLLAPMPVILHEREYGLAEDLPANTVHVFFARGPLPMVPRLRQPVTLRGVLEIGPWEEADGRISQVRLRVPTPITAILPPAAGSPTPRTLPPASTSATSRTTNSKPVPNPQDS